MIGYKITISLLASANFAVAYLLWPADFDGSTAHGHMPPPHLSQTQDLDNLAPRSLSSPEDAHFTDRERTEAQIAEVLFSDALSEHLRIPLSQHFGDEIHPELIKLFDLSETECRNFMDCLDHLSLRIEELRQSHATVTEIDDRKLRVVIDSFTAAGVQEYHSFIEDLEKAIGSTKARVFGEIAQNSVFELFKSLGEKAVIYEIEPVHKEKEEIVFSLTRRFNEGDFPRWDRRIETLEKLEQFYPGIPSLFPPDKLASMIPATLPVISE